MPYINGVDFNQLNGTHTLDPTYLHHQMGLRGINAAELADASGLTQATLSRISRGAARARPRTLAKIAAGLAGFPVIAGVEPMLVKPDGNGEAKDSLVAFEVRDAGDGGQPPVKRVIKARRPLRVGEGTPPAFVGRWRVIDLTKPKRPKDIAPVRTTSTEAMKEA